MNTSFLRKTIFRRIAGPAITPFALAVLLIGLNADSAQAQGFVPTQFPDTLFEEDFESPNALDSWSAWSNTEEGRIQIIQDPEDSSNHVVQMEDTTNNEVFSVNRLKTDIDIGGYVDLQLEVKWEPLNDEEHLAALGYFDGIILKLNTGQTATINFNPRNFAGSRLQKLSLIQHFSQSEIETASSLELTLSQYDNFSAPDDGALWDDIKLTGFRPREILPEAPAVISESDETFSIPVVVSPAPDQDLQLALILGNTQHSAVIFPAGQTLATLSFPGFDDDLLDGTQSMYLRLTDGHFVSQPFHILVEDDEFAGLSMTLQETIDELGSSMAGSIQIASPLADSISVSLESSDPDVLQVASSVYISRYSSQSAVFTLVPTVNPRVTGDQTVTITARFGSETVSKQITVIEGHSLDPILEMPPPLIEGESDQPLTISVNAILDSSMTIDLSIDDPSLSLVPTQVVIQPGESFAEILVSVADDELLQGNRTYTLTAAVQGGGTFTSEGTIIDDDIELHRFFVPDVIEAGVEFSAGIVGVNADGVAVPAYTGMVDVYLADPFFENELLLLENVELVRGRATVRMTIPEGTRNGSLVARQGDPSRSCSSAD